MSGTAKSGLSRHPTKGFRIKIGKTAGGTYRTFWLGHDAAIADYFANTLRGQFEHMKVDVAIRKWPCSLA